jgi:hypothetical protein
MRKAQGEAKDDQGAHPEDGHVPVPISQDAPCSNSAAYHASGDPSFTTESGDMLVTVLVA